MRVALVVAATCSVLLSVGCGSSTGAGSSTGKQAASGSGSTGSSSTSGSTGTTSTSGSTGTTACAGLVPPDQAANCPCQSGHTCTANNCYGGYWCDTNQNRCVRPPTNCGTSTTTGSTTAGTTTTGGSTGSVGGPGPQGVSNLPTCSNRPSTDTQINAVVRVDQYLGVRTGGSGQHEDFYGTITQVVAVADSSKVDTMNVEVAMRIASSSNPAGLPNEIPLTTGELIEVAGDYIPSSTASCSDPSGSCAVIHFTHSPCGWVYINPSTYQ